MSQIAKDLQYISAWLEYLNPDFVYCYNRGLTRQKIDELVKDLPFKLSEEVYELYQWGNGIANDSPIDFLFPEQLSSSLTITFDRLQDAIYGYKTIREATNYNDDYWHKKWFSIATLENKRTLYVIGDMEVSPVCLWEVHCFNNPVRVYKNLTSMISTIAECCELDLYQLISDPYGYGEDEMIIRIDETKLDLEKAIYQKYNL
jgi:hypothetical protein